MSSQILRAILLAVASAAVAFPLGYFYQAWAGWSLFCVGVAVQMGFHFRNFARQDRWSKQPVVDATLEGESAWDGIFGRLYRHEKDLRGKIERRVAQMDMLIAAGQALTDGVVLLDRHDAIEFCNTTAELQLGLAVATDRGQPIVNLVRQPEFAVFLKAGDYSRPLIPAPGWRRGA